jgi:hypothetical protein
MKAMLITHADEAKTLLLRRTEWITLFAYVVTKARQDQFPLMDDSNWVISWLMCCCLFAI